MTTREVTMMTRGVKKRMTRGVKKRMTRKEVTMVTRGVKKRMTREGERYTTTMTRVRGVQGQTRVTRESPSV